MKRLWQNRILWGSLSAFLVVGTLSLVVLPPLWSESVRESPTQSSRPRNYSQSLQAFMDFVSNRYVDEVEAQKLFEGALKGMLESLDDPYSQYLNEKEYQSLTDTTTGEFGGVGLFINKVTPGKEPLEKPEEKYVQIALPIEGTPGAKAGLMAGDLITKINGEPTESFDVETAQKKIRGRPGSSVTLSILRGENWEFDVTLTRAVIEVPTVKYTVLNNKYGYIQMISFTDHTPERVEEAVKSFLDQNVTGLILDVRSNPGGLLPAVIRILDGFYDDGLLVSTKGRTPSDNMDVTAEPGTIVPPTLPVVVMINKDSASASEILAGGLKDRNRAFIFGEKSFGKGSVQQVLPFGTTGFKITTARWYTPSGATPDKVGVTPHKEFKVPELTEAELEQLRKLLQDKKIETWAKGQKTLDPATVNRFSQEILSQGYVLPIRVLRRLAADEVRRINSMQPPVVDLDYDLMLAELVKLMDAGAAKP